MTLSEADSAFLREVIRRESSIVLEPDKDYLLTSRLTPVVRAAKLTSIDDLVARLRAGARARELTELVVEAMTTNETSFFRDVHPWNTLRDTLLPNLIERRQSTKSLTIYCAACSSGQEPYTIAMVLHEHFPTVAATWNVKIIGTDLSPKMVERTNAGEFSQLEVGRGLPAAMLPKHFERVGAKWRVKPTLRSMVSATVGNLTDREAWSKVPDLDAVFLRNVLIYFDRDTKSSILRHASDRLRNDGFVLLGSSETTIGLEHSLVRRQADKTVYFELPGAPSAESGATTRRTVSAPAPPLARQPAAAASRPLGAAVPRPSSLGASASPRPIPGPLGR